MDDVDATRLRMESAGIEFLWETQRESGRAWAHYRGPDGVVYELIGPDRVTEWRQRQSARVRPRQ